MPDLEIVPRGPFSLDAAREFAGGFPAGIGGGGVGTASITLAFPVEGADASVAAELWQDADGVVRGRTDAPDELVPALVRQASRSLSLDHDGTGWPARRRARPGHRRPAARARLPAAGLLLLGVRGGRRRSSSASASPAARAR